MHAEDDILDLSPIGQNRNSYHRKEKCDDESSIVLLDDDYLGDTIITGNPYLGPILSTHLFTHW